MFCVCALSKEMICQLKSYWLALDLYSQILIKTHCILIDQPFSSLPKWRP
jgi:hypothetical protein